MTDQQHPEKAPKRNPRRAPAPDERRLDPERTRRLLVEAAIDEFAAKGYAGARVQDIADRAGVNKQLIAYHFGGKEGLYQELDRQWLAREATFATPDVPLDELVARYLHMALDDPRFVRLALWQSLTGSAAGAQPEDLSDLQRRQNEGELGAELDPAAVMLMLYALVMAPLALPQTARQLFGLEPDSPEFRRRYTEQLRRLVRRLADRTRGAEAPTGSESGERAGAAGSESGERTGAAGSESGERTGAEGSENAERTGSGGAEPEAPRPPSR
ncbi:TetR/AcrR family transcriptional regulator [Streptomyces montanus]|uniref:TetR/AcrR family transcriptional regulator n=1 Tax=Streptomyces montanus TaxID=2580423 RepID=A0A5R9FJ48_9ACTN|nr:TetR family transcriptional regulator [Streptomyces montanus]TLS42110.1 TetR/AcrR family transcriptional regulator [Streptomyces montanus]